MTQGEAILNLVRNMQKLNGEIATLLKTFERSMAEKGFRNRRGSAVTKDCSYSIDSPEYWTPPYMYRILSNKKDEDDVVVLNVVLDDPDDPGSVEEPLVACGRFKFQKNRAEDCADEWDASELWHYTPRKVGEVYFREDLPIGSDKLSEWSKGEIDAMQEIRLFAVPLADVVDSRALDKLIIQRIL